ncbi:MAG: arginine--tRNA ligase [Chloroflexi bacterium]|nr:arginine--tRNA ligase [Chloroflexota bacterium]
MIKDDLKRSIEAAIERATERGDLPPLAPPEIVLEHPARLDLGDYATNVALRLQRTVGKPPREVAGAITHNLELPPSVAAVQVAGPGFINLFLADEWLQDQVDVILAEGSAFGRVPLGNGTSVQVEFVSANPTGPLHVGAARNAALGDTVVRLLEATDHRVQREYYINDAGSRIQALGASVLARYRQMHGIDVTFPEDGYAGEYVAELAREIAAEQGRSLLDLPEDQATERIGRLAEAIVMHWIERDLVDLRVQFDRWFSEQSLYDEGRVAKAIEMLREGGYVVEREGAVWFASTEMGEDRDNVLVRTNGQPTYFASDVAYHYDKFVRRGFDRVIDVWAADHQGHVPRMKAMVRAFGIDPDRLTILLYQLVKLFEHGKELKMSKRAGTYVTVRELLDEVGADAARFFLIQRSSDVTMNFDLDLAKKSTDENPVFYVQYAHARTASIFREAEERLGGVDVSGGDVRLLATESELGLIRKLLLFPEVVESATLALAPHQLPFYLQDLATAFSSFYRDCPVLPPRNPELALTKARLKLVAATRQVLASGLGLIGVSAPERMAERASSSA